MSYNLHLLLSTVYLQQDNSVENVHLQLVCSKQINNNTHPLRGVFLTNNYELYYKSLVHFSVKKLMFVIKKFFWQCVLFIFCILLYCYIFGSCFGFTILLSPVFLRFFPFLWFLPPFSWSSCPHPSTYPSVFCWSLRSGSLSKASSSRSFGGTPIHFLSSWET